MKRPESVALSEILYMVFVTWNEENMQKLGKLQEGATAMAGRRESHYSWRRVKYLAAFVWLSKKLKEDMTGVCKCIRQETGKQLNKAMEQGWQMEKQFMLR